MIAAQIDTINNTIYFTDGDTLEVDNAFITQQAPVPGAYVVDGVKVMSKGEFEEMHCEEVISEPVDEGEVIDGLRQDLEMALALLDVNDEEIKELKVRLSAAETEGGAGQDALPLEGMGVHAGNIPNDLDLTDSPVNAEGTDGSDPIDPVAPSGDTTHS